MEWVLVGILQVVVGFCLATLLFSFVGCPSCRAWRDTYDTACDEALRLGAKQGYNEGYRDALGGE